MIRRLLPLVLILFCACGSSTTTAPGDQEPPRRIFVAPGGTGDGTDGDPAGLVDALAAANPGDTLSLAAGEYPATTLRLENALTIRGAGSDATTLPCSLRVCAPDSAAAMRIEDLRCKALGFANECPDWPSRILATRCAVDLRVSITAPPNHVTEFDDCDLTGGIRFAHDVGDSRHLLRGCRAGFIGFAHGEGDVINSVRDCEVAGDIGFSHGGGAFLNAVIGCDIAGIVATSSGGGGELRIEGNTIGQGLSDSSGGSETVIRGNHFLAGGISDSSGGIDDEGEPVEDHVIENNIFDDGAIISNGHSVTIRDNEIHCESGLAAVVVRSGAPTHVIGNTISVPMVPPPPDFDIYAPDFDGVTVAIYTASAWGEISGNAIAGGTLGLYDTSGAHLVADNAFTGQAVGVWTAGGGHFLNNSVTGATRDGMVFAARGPITGNTITGCGGAGLRLLWNVDAGGGADGGLGGNVFRNNAGYDLLVEAPADQGEIFAKFNLWDHASAAEIDEHDIWDGKDDPTLATVTIEPLGDE